MHIGGLKPCNNVFLAPMAGVTDLPMRELAVELGAGMAVAPPPIARKLDRS